MTAVRAARARVECARAGCVCVGGGGLRRHPRNGGTAFSPPYSLLCHDTLLGGIVQRVLRESAPAGGLGLYKIAELVRGADARARYASVDRVSSSLARLLEAGEVFEAAVSPHTAYALVDSRHPVLDSDGDV
jgi:hypothetical protein